MKKRILSLVASAAMIVGLFALPLNETISAATELPAAKDGVITLTEDVTVTNAIVLTSNVTLDLNGHKITNNASGKDQYAICVTNGTTTIQDSTGSGTIEANYDAICASNSGKIIINSGKVNSTSNTGISVLGNRTYGDASAQTPEVTVNGGTITGVEGAAFVSGRTAKLNVTGGTLTSSDNFAILGNGSKSATKGDQGGYEINISGGTITGNIKSAGYLAGGIYHPNYGTLNISGGTIIANGGAGIVARAGQTNITGGTITATGTSAGWVGDKKSQIESNAIAFDAKPTVYPGLDDSARINVTGNATIKSDASVDAVKTYGENSQTRISLTSGTYTNSVSDYVAYGYSCVTAGTSYQVVANATPVVPDEPSADVKEITVGTNAAAAEEIKTTLNSVLENLKLGTTIDSSIISSETQTKIKDAIDAGETISTSVAIEPIDEKDISAKEKSDVLNVIKTENNEKVEIVSYMDFTIAVEADKSGVIGSIDQLSSPIKFTVAIPKDLKKDGRTFTIVRVHGDEYEELTATVNDDGTISFETDKFSTYALISKDTVQEQDQKKDKDQKKDAEAKTYTNVKTDKATNGVNTGDDTNMALLFALLVGSAGVFAIMGLQNKKRYLNK